MHDGCPLHVSVALASQCLITRDVCSSQSFELSPFVFTFASKLNQLCSELIPQFHDGHSGGEEGVDLSQKQQIGNNRSRQPSKRFGVLCGRRLALINAIKMLVFPLIDILDPCYNY